MKLSWFSKPSPQKREGEDAVAINEADGRFAVMDGVTPLNGFKDEDGHNGAYLAANMMKAEIERRTEGIPLREMILNANRNIHAAMKQYGLDVTVKHDLWATCVAAVQLTPDRIEYAQLGDSLVIAKLRDGTVQVLTENRVKGVSARAKAKRERDRSSGMEVNDESYYDDDPRHVFTYNRWMANTPDGYGVANGMEEAADYMQEGSLDLARLSHLLLVSDGMFHPELPLERTMELILKEGFEAYVARVEAAEAERQMRPDDRSALLLRFE